MKRLSRLDCLLYKFGYARKQGESFNYQRFGGAQLSREAM